MNTATRPDTGTPESFYNALAAGYDRMTGFASRVAAAQRFIERLGDRFCRRQPLRGVDLGCGTGAYTLALARCGMTAAGVDLAGEMLAQARRNASRLGLEAVFLQGSITALPDALPRAGADVVLCLGNTVPHLLDPDDLGLGLAQMHGLLADGGVAVVQTLNYDKVLNDQDRIVSVDRDGATEFIRFYDFLEGGLVRFNLLRIDWQGDKAEPAPLNSVLLRPYRLADLRAAALGAGCRVLLEAGGLDLAPFAAAADTAVIVLGRGDNRLPA